MSAKFDATALMREAEVRTRLDDWGWFDIETPLEILTQALNDESRLHARGQQAARERLLLVLSSRLRVIEDRKRHPKIAQQEIRAPLVIPGLPRSGTTTLFQLLGQDPAHRVPRAWEILMPSPPPERTSYESDPRIAKVQSMLESHGFTEPSLMAIHPFGARIPEECIFVCEHALTYTPYGAFWNVPSYGSYNATADHRPVFAVHKELLQQLQFRSAGERWVLKAPGHMFHLPEIVETYPDARFIQTHRDLGRIIPSLAKLFVALRRTFSDDPTTANLKESARQNLTRWETGLRAMTEFRKRPGMEERFVDVQYRELLAQPIETIERIYRRFGLDLTGEAKSRMRDWLANNRQGRHGAHPYSLAECGLSDSDVDGVYAEYFETYGVQREERR